MNPISKTLPLITPFLLLIAPFRAVAALDQVQIPDGRLQGTSDSVSGVERFAGIPFAAPPVGDLRWRPPQPEKPWQGVRQADKFGPNAMEHRMGDTTFRSTGMSEDCLYLNVWTPARTANEKLPVLLYFFGGGFMAGDGSEERYDGASLAKKGMVTVTANYRLNVFGFFAHPELTKESPHHASGDYGLLDQNAALQWVRRNIAAFGGDPNHITIGGESAGSISVSAQMASPLSRDLIAGVIGESGSILVGPPPINTLAEAEAEGVKFANSLGLGKDPSLAALRAVPAEKLFAAAMVKTAYSSAWPDIDGWFLPKDPMAIYQAGEQAHVPLLAGVNSQEGSYPGILHKDEPTVENYRKALTHMFGGKADAAFKLYPAGNETEVMESGQLLASDIFMGLRAWTWAHLAEKTGGQPTYFYLFTHPRPLSGSHAAPVFSGTGAAAKPLPVIPRGAFHASEIEYALGNLGYNHRYRWTPEDQQVSAQMEDYFANFIKTGNPNGSGLPEWPRLSTGKRLVIDVKPHADDASQLPARYGFLESVSLKKKE